MSTEKISYDEALQRLKAAAKKGYNQGMKLTDDRNALKVVIAYRIKEQRNKNKITQAALSDIIGTNPLTYRGYENCVSEIPIVFLIRIADTLNVSIDYLTGRTDNPSFVSENYVSLEERISRIEALLSSK